MESGSHLSSTTVDGPTLPIPVGTAGLSAIWPLKLQAHIKRLIHVLFFPMLTLCFPALCPSFLLGSQACRPLGGLPGSLFPVWPDSPAMQCEMQLPEAFDQLCFTNEASALAALSLAQALSDTRVLGPEEGSAAGKQASSRRPCAMLLSATSQGLYLPLSC